MRQLTIVTDLSRLACCQRVLTGHPVAAVVAHEVDGRVDHVHRHVDAGGVAGRDAVARRLEEAFDARTSISNRLTEN